MNENAPVARPSEYRGAKDIGRSDSLYQSALTKPDLDYSTHLLFSALEANPDNEAAFQAVLAKSPELAAKKKVVRIGGTLTGGRADEFLRSLALFAANPTPEQAIGCAGEAHKIGLIPQCTALGKEAMRLWETGKMIKPTNAARLIEVMEACGAFDSAVRAAALAVRGFPDDQSFREREKNLLARKYLTEHDPGAGDFRTQLQNRAQQEAAQRPADPASRFNELEHQFRGTRRLEDFREIVRAVRELAPDRRESALAVLQEGFDQFGEKETLWLMREIKLERRWSEVRVHRQTLAENPADATLQKEHEQLRQAALREHVEHLYEVVTTLPPGPDRQRRELELTRRLFEAGRYEEAIKQAQRLKGRPELRLDAWVVMAKAFVQLGLTIEAGACFDNILAALNTDAAGNPDRVLDAKYSYAEFLTTEAARKKDAALAAQARRLCADVMLEDINYRGIRDLSAKADALMRK